MPFFSSSFHSLSHLFALYFPVILFLQIMSSEIFWCAVTFVLVGCASIFWFFLDHVKKRRGPRKKIWICSDVLMDILPFFDHAQLGLKMALLSDRFDVLVDAHFNGKTTELTIRKTITISKDKGPKAKLFVLIGGNFVDFPLPDHSLPIKIRFHFLQIDYIDYSVIAFLHANKQIWDRMGTKLELFIDGDETEDVQPIWDVLAREIWPIFASNIRHLSFFDAVDLDNLRRRISPTLLTDFDQLNSICSYGLFPDGIADDGPNATGGQALFKWLHTPRKDGQPKRLHSNVYLGSPDLEWINNFKETFLRATTSVSYHIQLYFYVIPTPNGPFELVNEVTNEKLTLWEKSEKNWLLKRCPITATLQWENDENWDNNLNNVQFNLWRGNDSIGPLSPPAEEEKEKMDE